MRTADALDAAITGVVVEIGFVAPYGFAFLEARRLLAAQRGVALRLQSPSRGHERPFWEVIGFGGTGTGSPTTVRLRRFGEGDEGEIGRFLLEEWVSRAERLSQVASGYVVGSVGEIFANALTHARSPVGVVSCGQYFPTSGNLHLSVVDAGIGIPASLAEAAGRREEEIDPAAAIAWAFERGHSTLATSRGLGLANIRAFIRRNGATLHVFSGGAYAMLTGDRWSAAPLGFRFPGTLVDLEVPTAQVRTPSPSEKELP